MSGPAISEAEKGGAVGATHTPGPWRTQGWVPTWAYIPVHDAAHNLVASLYPDSSHGYTREQVEANARVIVAAPAMLSLLRNMIAAVEANQIEFNSPEIGEPEVGIPMHPWHEEWLHEARAAIARAESQP